VEQKLGQRENGESKGDELIIVLRKKEGLTTTVKTARPFALRRTALGMALRAD